MDGPPGAAPLDLERPYAGTEALSGLLAFNITADGHRRRFLLYVPRHRRPGAEVPLWILAPGWGDTAERMLTITGLVESAEKHHFAFVALEGKFYMLNVVLRGRASDKLPDDVKYTRQVLQRVVGRVNIDMRQIKCVGFSRGARFCSRLGSELSSFVTGVAAVSGIRFPRPNNATRPVPIIAFHGTADPMNPFNGHGNPVYWESSVPDAVRGWAKFNGCRSHAEEQTSFDVNTSRHYHCSSGADVVLVKVAEGGHTWPGGSYNCRRELGYNTQSIDARELIYRFFKEHPVALACRTAVRGEPCYDAVTRRYHDAVRRPWRNVTLDDRSRFNDIQAELHRGIHADCALPCPIIDVARPPIAPLAAAPPLRSLLDTALRKAGAVPAAMAFAAALLLVLLIAGMLKLLCRQVRRGEQRRPGSDDDLALGAKVGWVGRAGDADGPESREGSGDADGPGSREGSSMPLIPSCPASPV